MTQYLRLYGSELRFVQKGTYDEFFEEDDDAAERKIELTLDGRVFWQSTPTTWMQNHDFPKTVPDYKYLIDGRRFGAVETPYSSPRRDVPGEDGIALVIQVNGEAAVAAHMTYECARSFAQHLMWLASPEERAAEQRRLAESAMAKWTAHSRRAPEPDTDN